MTNKTKIYLSEKPYKSKDIAIIIPTKNRVNEIRLLLNSIAKLNCEIGRVIVIASGQDIWKNISEYNNYIPLEYFRSESGQIKQRNLGIKKLDEKTRLVATMDDDAIFHEDSVSKMIDFWNKIEPETAGVGFNIINQKCHKHTWLRGLIGVSVSESGRILKSGINTPITNVKKDN